MPRRGRDTTGIEWTHFPDGYLGTRRWTGSSWNPLVGCTRVSPGCENCYALAYHNRQYRTITRSAIAHGFRTPGAGLTVAQRARAAGIDLPVKAPQYDLPFNRVQLLHDRIEQPLHWRNPHSVFVNSMSDLYHEEVPDAFIAQIFGVMSLAAEHVFMILTKRPERMRPLVSRMRELWHEHRIPHAACGLDRDLFGSREDEPWPLSNVWNGVSVEAQEEVGRIALLLDTPSAVRFVSYEPALGPLGIGTNSGYSWFHPDYLEHVSPPNPSWGPAIDWVIVGGESGNRSRPPDIEWVKSMRRQCATAEVAYFGKQRAGVRPGLPLPEGLDLKEWPAVGKWPRMRV